MRRDPALAPFSHQHQHGLAVALELTCATTKTAVPAREEFLAFWENEGRQHFRLEEEILLPAVARHLPPVHEAVVRVLVEHVDLRRRAAELAEEKSPDLENLRTLGQRLNQHIRHEERVLFPLIETSLPAEELSDLAAALERSGHAP